MRTVKHPLAVLILLGATWLAGCSSTSPDPRNVILMISDGCGYNHVAAAGLYQHGEPGRQVYEDFPVQYAMSTFSAGGSYDPVATWSRFDHCLDKPTDSAAAATAIVTGVKTWNMALGFDVDGRPLALLLDAAEDAGKATGVVSSVQFCHATGAGLLVRNPSRYLYDEIASDMIVSSRAEVILGCGHPFFDPEGRPTATPSFMYVGGQQIWEQVVAGTAGADANGDGIADPWTLIDTRTDFRRLATGPAPGRILGIPRVYRTLQQERGGDPLADPFVVPRIDTVPTLAEMTRVALNVVDEDPQGFFLMIEGGAVDWASHGEQFGRMIEEEIEFNGAVEAVVQWVSGSSNWGETLVIVTGDHETGYLTGPGSGPADPEDPGAPPTWNPLVNHGKGRVPGMKWNTVEHSNSLIPLFARGAGSDRIGRYADQVDPVRGPFLDIAELGQFLWQVTVPENDNPNLQDDAGAGQEKNSDH